MKRSRVTEEMYATIPSLIAEGKSRNQIAELFGVKVMSLQVMCSRRNISLWGRDRAQHTRKKKSENAAISFVDDCLPKIAAAEQLVALRQQARMRGVTEIGLMTRLVEKVVERKLYDELLGKMEDA